MKDAPAPDALPGTSLLAFARGWFPPAVVASVLEPLVADWQREWREAPRATRSLVRARGGVAFILTVLRLAPREVLAPLPGPLSGLLLWLVLGFCAFGVIGLGGLLALSWTEAPPPTSAWLFLLPVLFTALLPFAVGVGVDAIRSYQAWPVHVQFRAIFKLVAVVTVWMVVSLGWIAPRLGQEWQNAVDDANAGQQVSALTRVGGLTAPELLTARQPGVHPWIRPGDPGREIESRVYLLLLPALLACIRWRATERQGRQWYVPPTLLSTVTVVVLLKLSMSPYGPMSFLRQRFLLWNCLLAIGIGMLFLRPKQGPARQGAGTE